MQALSEPVLREDDLAAWDNWQRAAGVHAGTAAHRRHVASALRVVERCMRETPNAMVSWSGGKDSTVMTHLVCVRFGAPVDVVSEKDDLDYPGEEDYVRSLGRSWGLRLNVIRPPVSPMEWIASNRAEMHPGDEIHSRAAGLSKACFYGVMEAANEPYDAVMLGLRSEESASRRQLRAGKGRYYRLKSGKARALPIADWSGIDVYAYAQANGIELLPVYRCLGLMHADEPYRLRKSWWLPGGSARFGQTVWLRRYYPSLFRQLCAWMPQAGSMT